MASLANNHVGDCGPEGVASTLRVLHERGIRTVGAAAVPGEACAPLELSAAGWRVTLLSFLAMAPADRQSQVSAGGRVATWSRCDGERRIREATGGGGLVVVILHLHLERGWTGQATFRHIELEERALAAGAELVLAHGPHVPQGVITRPGGLAFLSLGKLVFGQPYEQPDLAHRSLLASVTVSAERLVARTISLELDEKGRPGPLPLPLQRQEISRLAMASRRLGSLPENDGTALRFEVARRTGTVGPIQGRKTSVSPENPR